MWSDHRFPLKIQSKAKKTILLFYTRRCPRQKTTNNQLCPCTAWKILEFYIKANPSLLKLWELIPRVNKVIRNFTSPKSQYYRTGGSNLTVKGIKRNRAYWIYEQTPFTETPISERLDCHKYHQGTIQWKVLLLERITRKFLLTLKSLLRNHPSPKTLLIFKTSKSSI